MRIQVAFPALLFVLLLLVGGCGGGESSAPEEKEPTNSTAPAQTTAETTQNTTVASAPDESTTLAIIGSTGERSEVEVEIADDEAEQRRGLMERTELGENAGMLFVFDRDEPRSFWMRNTLIPLSIAYIASDGRIVDIQDMQPLDETSHPSAEPAQYALEVNQGFFAERGVQVGDTVELPRPGPEEPPGSAEVVQAFRDAGLEVGESYPVEQEPGWEERPVPRTYEEATRFLVPSLGADAGGRVFVFGSEEDLRAVRGFYEDLASSERPYVYDEGLVLVQISNQLPEGEAERYGMALKETV